MIYTVGITVVSCLIPIVGLVIGLYFMNLGKKRMKQIPQPGHMPGEKLVRIARLVVCTAGTGLVITVIVMALTAGLTHKGRVLTAVLVVSLQYITAMVVVVIISKLIVKKDSKK